MISSIFVENVSEMYINISYKFQRIPDTQSHFITKVHDLLEQPSYRVLMENRIPLKPMLVDVRIVALSISSHELTQ